MGKLGQPEDADVVKAIEQALKNISAAGVGAGVNAFNETIARRYVTAGAGFVLVGADATLVARGAEQLVARYRS
jgi:4-hydroxy-2-oxoheptanedioate aldolase